LAEGDFIRRHAFGEAKLRKLVGRPHFAARIGPQIRARAQQRVLEADPQPPWARLAVGHALQLSGKQRAGGPENLVDAVEADAADEVDIHRYWAKRRT